MGEPKYDEDTVNLGYLRKQLNIIQDNKANKEDIPTATSQLINDNDFVNEDQMNTVINNIDILNVHGQQIPQNSNLNNYTKAGVYYSIATQISASLVNTPVTNSGFKLIVEYFEIESRIMQTIKAKNSSTSAIWVRTNTGTWGEWKRIVTDDEIYYKPGDKYNSSTNVSHEGFITGGGKEIYVTVKPQKKLNNVSNVTVNTLKLNIRGISGYVGTSGADFKSYVSSAIIPASKDAIVIVLTNSSGWGVTNNTPVVVAGSSAINLTFS